MTSTSGAAAPIENVGGGRKRSLDGTRRRDRRDPEFVARMRAERILGH